MNIGPFKEENPIFMKLILKCLGKDPILRPSCNEVMEFQD